MRVIRVICLLAVGWAVVGSAGCHKSDTVTSSETPKGATTGSVGSAAPGGGSSPGKAQPQSNAPSTE